jgi:hypothetical protein
MLRGLGGQDAHPTRGKREEGREKRGNGTSHFLLPSCSFFLLPIFFFLLTPHLN